MIKMKRVEEICSRFHEKKLLVYGDVILDQYVFGDVERISPEAPVPVLRVTRRENRLGGAGNVAVNIDTLGAESFLVGICGEDAWAGELKRLKRNGMQLLCDPGQVTIMKTRIISGKQHIVRLDQESPMELDEAQERELRGMIDSIAGSVHGIIISDYAKGAVSRATVGYLKQQADRTGIPLIVDPKPHHFCLYQGVTGITPNLKEAEEMLGIKLSDANSFGNAILRLRKRLNTQFAVITRGGDGISAGERSRRWFHYPAFSHEVFDVTGAGDTVTAVIALALISGASLREAVCLSNAAASLVVEKIGTAQVHTTELIERTRFLLRKN